MLKLAAGTGLLLGAFALGWFFSATGVGQSVPLASLTDREREFTEQMRNVVLIGNFTIEGRERRDGLPERYEITDVSKLEGDRWRFNARVKYGNVDDTPMISITDFSIPGLGEEFGARVVFYDNRYAGTWDHGEYGGMMYGTITPLAGQ